MLSYRCDKDGKLHTTIYAEGGNWYCEKHIMIATKERFNAAMGDLNTWKRLQKKKGHESFFNE